MTELLSGVQAPSDAELISRVRGGDVAAYGELFARHVEAAKRLGRQLVRGPDIDDLVSDAFAKVLQVLQGGGGPDVAFRAYLLTAVRRLHVDRVRAASRVQPSDDMAQYDDGIPFQDTAVTSFENGAAARAFASLPERWQLVLWHLEVEGNKPADIAPLLGMSANSVSALAYRAREGLRQAFLTMHLADTATAQCRWVNEHLGAYVRRGLSRRDTTKVEQHLDECRRCTAMYVELDEVNSNLAGIIAPLLLGAAAAGYLSSSGAAGAGGVLTLLGRVRDAVTANVGVATTGAVAAGVASVVTTALVVGAWPGQREVVVSADEPVGVVQAPARDLDGADRSDRRRDPAARREATTASFADPTRPELPVQAEPTAPAPVDPVDPGLTDPVPPVDLTDPDLPIPVDPTDPDLPVPVDPTDLPVPVDPTEPAPADPGTTDPVDPVDPTDPGTTPGPGPVENPGPPSDGTPPPGNGDTPPGEETPPGEVTPPGEETPPGDGTTPDEDTTPGQSDGQPGGGNDNDPGNSGGSGGNGNSDQTGGGDKGADQVSGDEPGNGTGNGTGGGAKDGDDLGGGAPVDQDTTPAPTELAFAGSPTVTSPSDQGAGRHRYQVSLTVAGVQAGDTLTVSLEDPEARLCDVDCSESMHDAPTRLTFTVPAGASTYSMTFLARLPGSSPTTLTVARTGTAAPLTWTVRPTP